MIEHITRMTAEEQVRLLEVLGSAPSDVADLDDAALSAEVIRGLRDALQVPSSPNNPADLPEYIRRRLVEVARKDFGIDESFDVLSDLELARCLVEGALAAAERLTEDESERAEFAKFLRTKHPKERYAWLMDAGKVAALARGSSYNRPAISDRAQRLAQRHEATAKDIVTTLGKAQIARRATGLAVGSALATTIAALGGGLYMSGLTGAAAANAAVIHGETAKERQRRARRSRLVQNVMALCAFVVASVNEEAELATTVGQPR